MPMIQVVREIEKIGEFVQRPVISIGNFDGVHRGHQALLQEVITQARVREEAAWVFTFDPHPVQVLAPEKALPMLQTVPQRIRMFEAIGVDGVILFPFTKPFAALTAREFVEEILVNSLKISAIIIGSKFRFGAGREGDVELLLDFGEEFGFDVLPFQEVRREGETISSSRVRQAIMDGDLAAADKYLGHVYSVQGKVVDGIKLGKKLGYPTANVKDFNQLLPRNGVYAVECQWRSQRYPGAASIGVRPTIDTGIDLLNRERVLEVHLLDFHHNIYDEEVEIYFYRMLRTEYRFDGIGDLVRQMAQDVEKCRAFFREKQSKDYERVSD